MDRRRPTMGIARLGTSGSVPRVELPPLKRRTLSVGTVIIGVDEYMNLAIGSVGRAATKNAFEVMCSAGDEILSLLLMFGGQKFLKSSAQPLRWHDPLASKLCFCANIDICKVRVSHTGCKQEGRRSFPYHSWSLVLFFSSHLRSSFSRNTPPSKHMLKVGTSGVKRGVPGTIGR